MTSINGRHLTIRQQLVRSFLALTALSSICVMVLGVASVHILGSTARNTVEEGLVQQMQDNSLTIALEVAAAVEHELTSIGQAVSMSTALQTAILSAKHELREPPLAGRSSCMAGGQLVTDQYNYEGVSLYRDLPLPGAPSYREFDLVAGCSIGNECPQDFAVLQRLSSGATTQVGSLEHSSVYLYRSASGADGHAARTDTQWTAALNSFPESGTIETLIENTAHLDAPWKQTYDLVPDMLMMYLLRVILNVIRIVQFTPVLGPLIQYYSPERARKRAQINGCEYVSPRMKSSVSLSPGVGTAASRSLCSRYTLGRPKRRHSMRDR